MLSGSISSLGSHYVITLDALNAHTGDPLAREQIEAESKEKVLSSLGTAASNLRMKLGESLSSVKKFEVPIEQATTSSLEALKAYAMGNEERTKGRARESVALYKRAVELDPNFAMAYARIAVFYGNQTQLELAREYVQKAFDLRERVSEREKLYISEKYYNYVTGEIDKAFEVLQTWAHLYPNDFIPHNNLALNYSFLGRYEEALKEALEAVRLSPTNTSARDNVITSFIGLNRFISTVAMVVFSVQLMFVFNFFYSIFKGRRVTTTNPWVANTLEWTTPIRPGHGNWPGEIPEVHRWAYDYGKDGRDFIQQTEPVGANESKH